MQRVPLGKTGVTVSEMCLGTMMFGDRTDQKEADRIVGRALAAGVDFIDTAAMYCDGETEAILGRILAGRRDRVFLATKVRSVDGETIRRSIDESLRRLATDHVDLYLIHWPQEGMRPLEIMKALGDVVAAGKARYVGCCNYPAWLVAHSNAVAAVNGWANARLVCHQVPYNLVERGVEVEVLPQAAAEGIAITAYRPLLGGVLTGKYRPGEPLPADSRGQTDQRLGAWLDRYSRGIACLFELAAQKGLTPAQLAVAWVRSSPAVTCPIVGVSSLSQFEASLPAFEATLTADERETLSQAFGSEVWEDSGGAYKGLRRVLNLVG